MRTVALLLALAGIALLLFVLLAGRRKRQAAERRARSMAAHPSGKGRTGESPYLPASTANASTASLSGPDVRVVPADEARRRREADRAASASHYDDGLVNPANPLSPVHTYGLLDEDPPPARYDGHGAPISNPEPARLTDDSIVTTPTPTPTPTFADPTPYSPPPASYSPPPSYDPGPSSFGGSDTSVSVSTD